MNKTLTIVIQLENLNKKDDIEQIFEGIAGHIQGEQGDDTYPIFKKIEDMDYTVS